MRILDRYCLRQLLPVWLWCVVVFLFLSCLVDLFEHLDEILKYRIPLETVWQYYVNFLPLVFVRASPLALLFAATFISSRLVRHQELLAINVSGTSLLRASVPFLFVGWLASLLVFLVNEQVIPRTAVVYERLRQEAFRGQQTPQTLENVATLDDQNRLYHARRLDAKQHELSDLTVLEHDLRNRPRKTIYAQRAVFTPHGWLLLYGTTYRIGPRGVPKGDPEPFVERLLSFPVTPDSFRQPEAQPETMPYGQLRQLIGRLQVMGITNVRRYAVELASKVALPFMNVIVCLIGFLGPTRSQTTRRIHGLGVSLGWVLLYYIGVAIGQGIGKEGLLPAGIAVWAPHLAALALCWRALRR